MEKNKGYGNEGKVARIMYVLQVDFWQQAPSGNLATHHGSNHVMVDLEEAGTVSILSAPVHHHSSFIRRKANIMTYNARLD